MMLRITTLNPDMIRRLQATGWSFGGRSGSDETFYWRKWPEWPSDPRIDPPEIVAEGCKSRHILKPVDAE